MKSAKAWAAAIRDIKDLLAWALKLDERDPEGAEILRLWAGKKAAGMCQVPERSQSAAAAALRSQARIFSGKKSGVQAARAQKFSEISDQDTRKPDPPP